MGVVGGKGVLEELPGGAALLAAGAQDRPYSGVPLSAHEGPAALGDAAVDDGDTNPSFGGVVGRRDVRIEQEPEDGMAMFDQSSGQCRGLGALAAGVLGRQAQDAVLDPKHDPVEAILGDLLPQMPAVKEAFELDEQESSESLVDCTGQRGQELDVADQVGQAELLQEIGILDVGAEKVADNRAAVGLTEDLFQDLGASGSRGVWRPAESSVPPSVPVAHRGRQGNRRSDGVLRSGRSGPTQRASD